MPVLMTYLCRFAFRMSFADDVTFTDGESVKRRCLSCEYLDLQRNAWISDGCYVTNVDEKSVSCHCNHTTNFAAFMSPYTPEYTITKAQAAVMRSSELPVSNSVRRCNSYSM